MSKQGHSPYSIIDSRFTAKADVREILKDYHRKRRHKYDTKKII
jgi:hypothetical protein